MSETKETELKIAYKIFKVDEWQAFEASKVTNGNSMDIRDKYIHMCSTVEQLNRIIAKYFPNINIYIATINLNELNVKYEPISNGDIYPHLYDELKFDSVIDHELRLL